MKDLSSGVATSHMLKMYHTFEILMMNKSIFILILFLRFTNLLIGQNLESVFEKEYSDFKSNPNIEKLEDSLNIKLNSLEKILKYGENSSSKNLNLFEQRIYELSKRHFSDKVGLILTWGTNGNCGRYGEWFNELTIKYGFKYASVNCSCTGGNIPELVDSYNQYSTEYIKNKKGKNWTRNLEKEILAKKRKVEFNLSKKPATYPCSCFEVQIDSSFNNSSLIFKGKVKEIIKGKFFNYQGFNSDIVNFEVIEGYKKAKVEEGIVSIINYNSSCDYLFEEDKEYIVFANDLGYGHYSTSICTQTAEINDFHFDDLNRLKELSKNWIDDLYNYRDLLVIEKVTYNALIKENEDHVATIEKQKGQFKFLIYLIAGVVLSIIIFMTGANMKESSG
ncbi:hypothetical protein [Pararhodonellum marinum]|uniref:hypothetical protein n=1 Tax=Pararhodonellum marinum TaxID=2755358 RepID=UPI00188F358B|nr:hypothetical protein [Pararhodonellum marinum]